MLAIIFADLRSDKVPNLSILSPLNHFFLTFLEVKIPTFVSEKFTLKDFPFDLFVLKNY